MIVAEGSPEVVVERQDSPQQQRRFAGSQTEARHQRQRGEDQGDDEHQFGRHSDQGGIQQVLGAC